MGNCIKSEVNNEPPPYHTNIELFSNNNLNDKIKLLEDEKIIFNSKNYELNNKIKLLEDEKISCNSINSENLLLINDFYDKNLKLELNIIKLEEKNKLLEEESKTSIVQLEKEHLKLQKAHQKLLIDNHKQLKENYDKNNNSLLKFSNLQKLDWTSEMEKIKNILMEKLKAEIGRCSPYRSWGPECPNLFNKVFTEINDSIKIIEDSNEIIYNI